MVALRSLGAFSALLAAAGVEGFYLPGVLPTQFKEGDEVAVKVNSMTSVETLMPYNYYDLPFCKPDGGVKESAENLGEYLTGDRIENTGYKLNMRKDENCKVLCRRQYTKKQAKQFQLKIAEEYYTNWIVDNLPAATELYDAENSMETTYYNRGFPVGKHEGKDYKLYNHVKMTVYYHPLDDSPEFESRIVRFKVEPFSVKHMPDKDAEFSKAEEAKLLKGGLVTCNDADPIREHSKPESPQLINGATEVIWTYDVAWEESEVRWASRWDIYLSMNNMYSDEVHWFSIMNALLIVVFLTAMIAMILRRALHADINRYNRVPTEEERAEEREESGWKLVHADVFRPPSFQPMMFCVFVGSGAQLASMALVTVLFAAIGFLSPSNRGGLMVALLVLFVLMGVLAGYYSASMYRLFKGEQWRLCTIFTALLYPGGCFAVFFILNLIVWAEGSVAAVPFGSMFVVLCLWFGISVPMVYLGAYFGYQAESVDLPVATSNIPRPIPDQPWYMSLACQALVGGMLPFGAVFVEVYFILASIWMDQYYYVFGFLLLVFVIMLITCAEITVVLIYFQLCGEDYHWWWRSFLTAGATAMYVFLYSAYYFFTNMQVVVVVAELLYFGYMGLISFGLFLCNGVVGFMTTFYFLRKIYSAIKVD